MIMVTGAAGYLGCVLVKRLLDAGHNVIAVDCGWFPVGLRYLGTIDNLQVWPDDVRRLSALDFKDVDTVIHLAGLSNDPMAEYNPALNEQVNFHATVSLAEQAKAVGVKRFYYASSASVYDNIAKQGDLDIADAPARSPYPYSDSKLMAEASLRHISDKDFHITCLRQGTLWGYSPRMRYDLVVNTMTRDAISTNLVNIVRPRNEGTHDRPILHVDDCAKVYLGLLGDASVPYRIVNAVTENVSIPDLAIRIKDIMDDKRVTAKYHVVDKVRSYRVKPDSDMNRWVQDKDNKLFDGNNKGILELISYTGKLNMEERYDLQTRNIAWMEVLSAFGIRGLKPKEAAA